MFEAGIPTRAVDVAAEIDRMSCGATRYFAFDDPQVTGLAEPLTALAAIAPMQAAVQRAQLMALCGEVEPALHWLKEARQGAPGSEHAGLDLREALVLANLGYFSRAAQVLVTLDLSTRRKHANILLACGAWEELSAMALHPATPGYESLHPYVETALMGRDVLHRINVSQEHLQAMIDVGGGVLRRHRMFILKDEAIIHGGWDSVLHQFLIPTNARTATSMTMEAIRELIRRDLDADGLAFAFIGGVIDGHHQS